MGFIRQPSRELNDFFLFHHVPPKSQGDKMSQLYVRLPDELHAKLRVVAALKGESLNATMLAASQSYVVDWELKHGELPKPPQEE